MGHVLIHHDAALVPDRKKKPTTANTAASLQTTARDYAHFLEAVLSGARLKPETAHLWLAPQVTLPRFCIQCLSADMPERDPRIAWGLGWGLEPQSETFFQWGDNDRGRFKAFAIGCCQSRAAVVVFTNGFNGMSIMTSEPEIDRPTRVPVGQRLIASGSGDLTSMRLVQTSGASR